MSKINQYNKQIEVLKNKIHKEKLKKTYHCENCDKLIPYSKLEVTLIDYDDSFIDDYGSYTPNHRTEFKIKCTKCKKFIDEPYHKIEQMAYYINKIHHKENK